MKLLGLVLAALLVVTPCEASVLALSTHHQNTLITNTLTTATNNCPAGSLEEMEASYTVNTATYNSTIDSASNTWQTPFNNFARSSIAVGIDYAINTTSPLNTGGTIEATFSTATISGVAAMCITNALTSAPLDASGQSANGTGALSATSISTGTLAQASEVVIGTLATNAAAGTVSCGGSFGSPFQQLTGSGSIYVCEQVVSSTSSVAFAPSWTTSSTYITEVHSYKLQTSGSTSAGSMELLGVGHP